MCENGVPKKEKSLRDPENPEIYCNVDIDEITARIARGVAQGAYNELVSAGLKEVADKTMDEIGIPQIADRNYSAQTAALAQT